MEQNIKYTTDGKKVVVLGNLNSQEKIVQEVFIIDNNEIPSGENFVVKTLHDAPAVSWKEKRINEIEEKYNKTYSQKEKEYDEMCKNFDLKTVVVKEKLSFLKKLEPNLTERQLITLINFISGDIKYVVKEGYYDVEILEYDSIITTKEYGRFESLKLVSVFGESNGNLHYQVNRWSDGSGHWDTIYPCKTMEEALNLLKEKFNIKLEKGLTESLLKVAEKYNIPIALDKMEEYKLKVKTAILKNIEDQKKNLEKYNQQLLDLN